MLTLDVGLSVMVTDLIGFLDRIKYLTFAVGLTLYFLKFCFNPGQTTRNK